MTGTTLSLQHGRNIIGVAVSVLMAASMCYYVRDILVPYQAADAVRFNRPRGNLSDLYPRWLGSRDLLLKRMDPYSRSVTLEIQVGYYGRQLDPSRPSDPRDQQAFAYPAYVAFLLAPTLKEDFSVVQKLFGWFLIAITIASIPLWLIGLRWRVPTSVALIFVLLTIGSFGALQGLALQQLSLLVAAMLAGCFALLSAGYLVLAGVGLALATIKPQLAVPLASWLMLWAMTDLRRRWTLLAGFGISMLVLVGGAELILPGWIGKFWIAVRGYQQYTAAASALEKLLGTVVAACLTFALIFLVAWICWRTRNENVGSLRFAITTALVLSATVLTIPSFAPYNHLFLLPAVMLLVRYWRFTVRVGSSVRLIYFLTAVLILWPWAATMSLAVASLFIPPNAVQRAWAVPLYTSLFIPLGITALLTFLIVSDLRSGALSQA